jgi:hypothetical protein
MKLKKLISIHALVILVSLSCQNATAQLSKGNWLFEGNLGNISFGNSDSEYVSGTSISTYKSSGFSFDIFPRAGYFITNNFVLGATTGFGFNSGKSENKNTAGIKTGENNYSGSYANLIPFIRYYFPGKEKLRFYGQAGAGINITLSQKSEGKSFNGTTGNLNYNYHIDYPKKYNSFSANGLFGMNYFLSNTTALNSSIGYYYSKGKETSVYVQDTTPTSESKYSANSSRIEWSVGFTIFLDKQKN